MKIKRTWAMPNRWTFSIKPIKELLSEQIISGQKWIDPFAGKYSPATLTNDINPEMDAHYHEDALQFLSRQPDGEYDGALFDPPYSATQAKRLYDTLGLRFTADMGRPEYWSKCLTELSRIIKPKGIVICFGWNSNGIGKTRGFQIQEILLVAHGSRRNDTIVTIERKIKKNIYGVTFNKETQKWQSN